MTIGNMKCPKCESGNVYREYHPKGDKWDEYFDGITRENDFVKITKTAGVAKVECIVHHCRNCQYEWDTATAEATKPKRKRAK